jgi:hypothetical protein
MTADLEEDLAIWVDLTTDAFSNDQQELSPSKPPDSSGLSLQPCGLVLPQTGLTAGMTGQVATVTPE